MKRCGHFLGRRSIADGPQDLDLSHGESRDELVCFGPGRLGLVQLEKDRGDVTFWKHHLPRSRPHHDVHEILRRLCLRDEPRSPRLNSAGHDFRLLERGDDDDLSGRRHFLDQAGGLDSVDARQIEVDEGDVRRIMANAIAFTTGSCWPSRM